MCKICPSGWYYWNNNCYWFFNSDNFTLSESFTRCKNNRAMLVDISSEIEYEFLKQSFNQIYIHRTYVWVIDLRYRLGTFHFRCIKFCFFFYRFQMIQLSIAQVNRKFLIFFCTLPCFRSMISSFFFTVSPLNVNFNKKNKFFMFQLSISRCRFTVNLFVIDSTIAYETAITPCVALTNLNDNVSICNVDCTFETGHICRKPV